MSVVVVDPGTDQRWEVPDEIVNIIYWAADHYGIPRGLMLALAAYESGYNPRASNRVPPDDSWGLYQLNRNGGVGAGYDPSTLQEPRTNAVITAAALADEYQHCRSQHCRRAGNWYEAAWPWWNTRDKAFRIWRYMGATIPQTPIRLVSDHSHYETNISDMIRPGTVFMAAIMGAGLILMLSD